MANDWQLVGDVDEFEDRRIVIREVGNHSVGVIRWGSDLYVIRNLCPHAGGPICRGVLSVGIEYIPSEALQSTTLRLNENSGILACAWHRWEFDIASGRCVRDERLMMTRYRTIIRDGHLYFDPGMRIMDRANGEHVSA
jgi:nitrite reductase (NADH) small subunit